MFAPRQDFEQALASLRAGRLRIRQPLPTQLFRRKPKAHFHGTPELFFQTGGGTDFECPGGSFQLKTREVCIMPSGVPHAETPRDLRTPYAIMVCMQARDGFILQNAAAQGGQIMGGTSEHRVSSRGREAFRYLDEIAGASALPEKYRRPLGHSLLEAFLVTLLGEMNQPSGVAPSHSPWVAEAEKQARSNLTDADLSLAGVAANLGCSADYLSRRFQQERGVSFTAWLVGERVALARDLLRESRFNIAEVGWACGFSAPSYFIRVFHKHTGLTPRAFRLAAWENRSPASG